MARPKPEEIEKQLKKEDDMFYGDETYSGSQPDPESDDDVEEVVEDITGNEPEDGKPFFMADQVDKDEEARRSKPSPKKTSDE